MCGEIIEFPRSRKQVREVAGLVDVTMQTMTGRSFDVVLESGAIATVGQRKAEIEEVEGTPVHRQDLFVLVSIHLSIHLSIYLSIYHIISWLSV